MPIGHTRSFVALAGRVVVLWVAMVGAPARAGDAEDAAAQRHRMVEEIAADIQALSGILGKAALDDTVMAAIAKVPRHQFVPPGQETWAYVNHPLPIGHGQTISQPLIVALMTDLLGVGADDVVLEIGTGSGYQAAVLAEIVKRVHTIEIVEPLARQAESRLRALGYRNIDVRAGDGYRGWPEHAPFDAIVVTAAGPIIPPALLDQLRPGGRLVMPVGDPRRTQWLTVVHKDADGKITKRPVLEVVFVPLTGGD